MLEQQVAGSFGAFADPLVAGSFGAFADPLVRPERWCYGPAVMPEGPELEFRILGPVEVSNGAGILALGGPKQRALLADLILNVGTVVATSRLIDDLWGDDPPQTADHTVETYVSRLRRILRDGSGSEVVLTRSPGYVLYVTPDRVDAFRYEQLVEQGTAAAERGEDEEASSLLRAALALWRGEAFTDVLSDAPFLAGAANRLAERRLLALERRIEADLHLGRAKDLVSELEGLVAVHPYRETFHAQLMLALYRSGRQAEALAAFRRARELLVDELGIEPGPELRDLEQAILRQDTELERTPATQPRASSPGSPQPKAPPGLPSRPRAGRRRRGTLLAGGLALAVIAAGVPLALRHSGENASVPTNGIGVLSPSGTSVAASLIMPSAISSLAVGDGSVWATSPEGHAVYRIDPSTRSVTQTIQVGAGAEGIALDDGYAWVANALDGTVSRIDTSTARVVQTIGAGSEPTGVALVNGTVWVTDPVGSAVYRIDPASGRLIGSIDLASGPFGIASGAGSVWVTDPADDSVMRIDPVGGQPIQRIAVGASPRSIAFGFGSVWVANGLDSTISRIDPGSGRVTETIPVGDGPAALAIGGSGVWVADAAAGTVVRIDPSTGRVASSLHVGGRPTAVALVASVPWVGARASYAGLHRGGTLRLLSSIPFETIDPGAGYPTIPPAFFEATYDTLVTFQRVGGSGGLQLVPDLALAIPAPQAGGTEYTFVLRPGLRYSNGAPVRPVDFRYGLERVFELNPYERSFFIGLLGARRCASGSPCDLSRGVTVNDHARAVAFHLTAPDADFLYKLAFSFAAPIPPSVPRHDAGTDPVPATGPYMIARYVPGLEVDLVRNLMFREWSAAAQPEGFPDRIVWTFGLPVEEEIAAIVAGRADWMADPVPDVAGLSARFDSQVHVNPLLGIAYAAFNVTVPPFDDLRVRRAVSFAADRRKAVSLLGGPDAAQPTCQIIPRGLPGYRPYCPFTVDPGASATWIGPDLARARRLVAASQTQGMPVVVWGHEWSGPLGRYLVGVLRELGYRASLHLASDAAFARNVNDSRRGVQASVADWVADYPSASDFFDVFFRCSSFRLADPADTRSSLFFCHPNIDRQMDQADRLQMTDPANAAEMWAKVDREITDLAPWVPFVSLHFADFTSARVGNYGYNPAWSILLDQLWVR
jgi:YVTN family beta-propeller protein